MMLNGPNVKTQVAFFARICHAEKSFLQKLLYIFVHLFIKERNIDYFGGPASAGC